MSDSNQNLPPITGFGPESPGDEPGPFAPGEQVEQFAILREIGRGGMCVVYEARDTQLDRRVAIKALRPSLSQNVSVARRFFRESVLVGNLSHPNIVPIFCQGHAESGTPYFAMEYVEGQSIADFVESHGPLEPDRAIELACQACGALDYAHRREIIHRDITPRNILLAEDDGRARLVDFGVAQDGSGRWMQTTAHGGPVGTVGFMSPEQNLGAELDARTDVFSLGLVLYFMLTGRLAWAAENRAQLALAYQMQTPAPPSRVNPALPGWLDDLVLDMLQVDRERRPGDCRQVLQRLRAGRDEQIPVARPHRPAGTVRHRPRPWRRAAIVGLACMLLLLAGAGITALGLGWPSEPSPDGDSGPRQAALVGPDLPIPPPETPEPTPAGRSAGPAEPDSPAQSSPRPDRENASTGPLASVDDPPKPPEPQDDAGGGEAVGADQTNSGVSGEKPEPPAPPAKPKAIVLWVYQPDPTEDFESSRIRSGVTTLELTRYDPPRLRTYAFDPDKGLVPAGPDRAGDFRLTCDNGRLVLLGLDDDKPGRIRRVDKQPRLPRGMGPARTAFALKPFTSLFLQCRDGGMAQIEVQRVYTTPAGP